MVGLSGSVCLMGGEAKSNMCTGALADLAATRGLFVHPPGTTNIVLPSTSTAELTTSSSKGLDRSTLPSNNRGATTQGELPLTLLDATSSHERGAPLRRSRRSLNCWGAV